jgi:hypothetical protein
LGVPALETGVTSASDLIVLRSTGILLLIEVKSRRKRRSGGISSNQRALRDRCRRFGHGWAEVWVYGDPRRTLVRGSGGRVAHRLEPPETVRISGDEEALVVEAWEKGASDS